MMQLIHGMMLMMFLMAHAKGEFKVIGSEEPIQVVVGDDAVLPCCAEPESDVRNLTVEWRRNEAKAHVYRSRQDDQSSQNSQFKDRTSLYHDEMARGNISLKLTNVTAKDAGNYTCIVRKQQNPAKKGYVMLTVEPRTNKTPRLIEGPGHNAGAGAGAGFGVWILIIPTVIAIGPVRHM